MPVELHFDRLRTLWLLSRHGTLAATSRELGVTPSAVSQQLSTLESEVGAELLTPAGRGVELTPLGQHLAVRAGEMLASLERTAAEVEDVLCDAGGDFHVLSIPTIALAVVRPAVVSLRETLPSLDITVTDVEAHVSVERLLDRSADLAVVDSYPDEPWVVPDGLTSTRLGRQPMMLLVPDSLGLAPGPTPLAALAEVPWVLAPEFVACGTAARRACRAAGFEPRVRWETDDLFLMRCYVADGLGVTLQPVFADDQQPPGVDVRPVAGDDVHRDVVAVARTASMTRPANRAVLEALEATASERFRDA